MFPADKSRKASVSSFCCEAAREGNRAKVTAVCTESDAAGVVVCAGMPFSDCGAD
jgi:hypothetical protein